jgi:hypothetical protein
VQTLDLAADGALRMLDGGKECVAEDGVRERVGKRSPRLFARCRPSERAHRISREHAELVVTKSCPRCGDDAKALREKPGLRKTEESREELPPCEVTCRPDEDDHVVVRDQVLRMLDPLDVMCLCARNPPPTALTAPAVKVASPPRTLSSPALIRAGGRGCRRR